MKCFTYLLVWAFVGYCFVDAGDYDYYTELESAFGELFGSVGDDYTDDEDDDDDLYDDAETCLATGNNMIGLCSDPDSCTGMSHETGNCSEPWVCCVDGGYCGAKSTTPVGYFKSPGYPNTFVGEPTICKFQIHRCDDTICKVRIDFEDVEIAGPVNGTCKRDSFTAENLGGQLCGKLTSPDPIYLEFRKGMNILNLKFITDPEYSFKRKWKLKVTQIPCDVYRGCLQKFTQISGTIRSFNYEGVEAKSSRSLLQNSDFKQSSNDDSELVFNFNQRIGRQANNSVKVKAHMNDLSYKICIFLQPGFCSVQFEKNSPFHVGEKSQSSETPTTETPMTETPMEETTKGKMRGRFGKPNAPIDIDPDDYTDGRRVIQRRERNTPEDTCNNTLPYVVIPYDNGDTERFCGDKNMPPSFPEVISKLNPVVLEVRSRKVLEGFRYPGFALKYQQKPCTRN